MSGLGETYECAHCHGVFTKIISDEEAEAEMRATWRETPDPADQAVVCDACYALMSAWAQLDHPEYLR